MGLLDSITSLFGSKQSSQHAQQAAPAPAGPAKKVLIVEDEVMLAQAMEAKLKLAGYEVLKATNGQEGLDMAVANKPDVILSDILMPVMNGKVMLHTLRSMPEFKNTPVIMLTNAGDADNQRDTQMYDNANAFLIKSNVSLDEIVNHVRQYA